jgi:hypothetical protein
VATATFSNLLLCSIEHAIGRPGDKPERRIIANNNTP